jgi:hypothetical protein
VLLLRESVERCLQCDSVTPHSRRIVALPLICVAAILLAAVWGFFQQEVQWYGLGGILVYAAIVMLLRDREKFWGTRCERCRGKKLRELRRTKPTLDGNTEINIG